MANNDNQDRELNALLALATRPPEASNPLAARIIARAQSLPQQRPSRTPPMAAAMALAASLALGLWLGAQDFAPSLWQPTQASAETDSPWDVTGLSEALSEGDAL
jgi:hypothetical protein